MSGQLSLFECKIDLELSGSVAESKDRAIPQDEEGLICFEQTALNKVLPARYFRGLDDAAVQVRPFGPAVAVCGTGNDVECAEMRWGENRHDGAAVPTTQRDRGLWRRMLSVSDIGRCIVVADRFATRQWKDGRPLLAWVTPEQGTPFFLAGHWHMTSGGPVLSLLERASAGPLRRVGPLVPLMLAETDVWRWLNGRPWIVSTEIEMRRKRHSITTTASAS